ncbi:hypothetical protein AM571_PC01694 (plasmid) [Rhizobium etli 8C-3]|uniref:Uncharacterized protein n=1 Tax=Rhizobium etli 8C-3 TaxID=538025 RepID=A0A1L5PH69_RHIET|nr:DUF6064 family protein [Rhizobium etli]APO79425.1 hypothetical protein AM571_PC01694 [Rhizobium etli 8C-3]
MSEWWTYSLEDFLLFSPRVYWRMFELHNAMVCPLQALTLVCGLVMLALIVRRSPASRRFVALVLAILWAFVGWSFLWNRYATINWAAAYLAPAFAGEALLLFVIGTLIDGLVFCRRGPAAWTGYALLALALAGQPLLAPLQGRAWTSSEIFGVAPDPTSIGTLGFLLLARSKFLPLLLPIPLLWCSLSGLTLMSMGAPEAWASFAAVALALAACIGAIINERRPTAR